MEPTKERRLGTGRVAFLARIAIFRVKINAGHTMAMVYDEFKNELGISYGQFVSYVNKYIKGKPGRAKKKEVEAEKQKPKEKEGFTFNPKANKDLY